MNSLNEIKLNVANNNHSQESIEKAMRKLNNPISLLNFYKGEKLFMGESNLVFLVQKIRLVYSKFKIQILKKIKDNPKEKN